MNALEDESILAVRDFAFTVQNEDVRQVLIELVRLRRLHAVLRRGSAKRLIRARVLVGASLLRGDQGVAALDLGLELRLQVMYCTKESATPPFTVENAHFRCFFPL